MRTLPLALLLAALPLTACADGARTARDGAAADPSPSAAAMPTEVPAADGLVETRDLAIVMDRGEGPPELCLGPVAESWPPQCGGPALVGWDWAAHQGFERQGHVRWGSFHVTGTWDGERLTVTDAVAAASHDAPVREETPTPAPGRDHTAAELDAIAREVGAELPGAQGAYADAGHVWVDVTYDDGSLQAWAGESYGEDVVLVRGSLVDVG